MGSVTINPPKTPVTAGSSGVATATVPNVCKMPGPPAPFVPTPLPNIGKSSSSPKNYSQNVTIEGSKVAIKGATFKSMGDIASQGLGGGIVSSSVEGVTSFVGPGSMDVKIEGKNVQLLGDPMLNNGGAAGTPANAATMLGVLQAPGAPLVYLQGDEVCPLCTKQHGNAGQVAESPATQGDADQFVAAAEAASAKLAKAAADFIPTKRKKHPSSSRISTMLGVMKCHCGKTYAGNSQSLVPELYEDPPPKTWHAPKGEATKASISKFVANKAAFDIAWQKGIDANTAYNKLPKRKGHKGPPPALFKDDAEPFYLPGTCAAPQMMALAFEHNCYPAAMTERWFDSKFTEKIAAADPTGTTRVATATGMVRVGGASSPPTLGTFSGRQAVPSCGTCEIILTAMLCPTNNRSPCAHAAAAGVCRKCGAPT